MQSEGDKNGNDLPAVQTLTKSPAGAIYFLDSPPKHLVYIHAVMSQC